MKRGKCRDSMSPGEADAVGYASQEFVLGLHEMLGPRKGTKTSQITSMTRYEKLGCPSGMQVLAINSELKTQMTERAA